VRRFSFPFGAFSLNEPRSDGTRWVMRRLTCAITAALAACGPPAPMVGGKILWRQGEQLPAALAEARADGRPVMLYFTASW